MNQQRLKEILKNIKNTRVGVIGDYCIDAYWTLDSETRELSVETGKPTLAVTQQSYNLGGAGNVVKNLADIGVGQISAFAVVGNDIFGREMLNLLKQSRVNIEGTIVQSHGWQTSVYAKPYIKDEEQERFDFGRYNQLDSESEDKLIDALRKQLPNLDAFIVNQQLPKGVYSEKVVNALNALASEYPSKLFIVNSREQSNRFKGFICRLNAREAARLCGEDRHDAEAITEHELKGYALKIYDLHRKSVFISRGANGVFAFDGTNYFSIPGIRISNPVDIVGAGDTGVSAMTAALCVGVTVEEAAELSNFAAAVTVQKLRQTGSANPQEILGINEAQSIA